MAIGVGAAILGGAAVSAASSYLGGRQASSAAREGTAEGLRREHNYYRKRDRYDWRQAKDRGLTPQEFYGSSAAGNSASSGAVSTLGNQLAQAKQAQYQGFGNAVQTAASQAVPVKVAQINQQTALGTARIQAGQSGLNTQMTTSTQYAIAEMRNRIDQGKLDLSNKEFNSVSAPAAAQALKISAQEFKLKVNEVANTQPAWVREKTLLNMGVDNTIQTLILKRTGYDITKQSDVKSMSPSAYKKILTSLLAAKSSTSTGAAGVQTLWDQITDSIGKHSEAQRQNTNKAINSWRSSKPKSTTSGPYQSGPNMNYR